MNKCAACGCIIDGENDEELMFSLCDECKEKGGVYLIEYVEITDKDEFKISGRIILLSKEEFEVYFSKLDREIKETILFEHTMLVSEELFNIFIEKFNWRDRLN